MENNTLIPFIQHGFRKAGDIGKQVYGYCPLCSHKNPKMYINSETGLWDCKVCARKGNLSVFFNELITVCQKAFTPESALPLIKSKGLKYITFKNGGVGYNRSNDSYIFPLLTVDGKVHDIRIYRVGDKVISTKGCHAGLRGWENFEKTGEVWMTEGESDYYTMAEVFTDLKMTDEVICGIPGAGVFKAEWLNLFSNRKVNILLDNDDPGRRGAIRIFNKLSTISTMHFGHHLPDNKTGYDVRDLYLESGRNARVFMDRLVKSLRDMPEGFKDGESKTAILKVEPAEEKKEKLSRIRIPAGKVMECYKKWLHIEDDHILDVLFGTVIANRLPGDPLWVFIVAPPGGMKSELLMSLDSSPKIYTTTTVTPASLISGMNVGGNIDPSIIPKLHKKVLIIKDFTTILKLPPMIRDEIYGIFRDAYDGKTEKPFGNGVVRKYISHFGIVAGVTPAVYFHTEENSVLGERFLMYNIKSTNTLAKRMEMVERALANVTHEEKMRKELSETACKVLNYDYTKSPTPTVSPELKKKFIYMAYFATTLRATVVRDRYTKEVTHKPFSEISTRVAKQFMKLALGIAYFRGDRIVSESHLKIIRDIAIGTVPHKVEDAFKNLHKNFKDKQFTISQATDVIGLPSSVSSRVVEDFKYLKILNSTRLSSVSTVYTITDEFKEIIKKVEIYD